MILRYADELREPESFFDKLDEEPKADAVKLAVNFIEEHSGKFEPQKMPNEYALAVHELVQAKIEQRAPEVEIESEKRETPKVVNIMDALKKSMQAKGEMRVKDSVAKRAGKSPKRQTSSQTPRPREVLTTHGALVASTNQFPAHFAAQEVSVFLALRFNHSGDNNQCRSPCTSNKVLYAR